MEKITMKKIVKKIILFPYFFINRISFLLNKIQIDQFPLINGVIYLRNQGNFKIGKNCIINSSYFFNPTGFERTIITVEETGSLIIKDNVGISNTAIYCSNSIVICDNVFIGAGVKIYDTDFHSIKLSDRITIPDRNVQQGKIIIESGAFIGAGTYILKNATIGKESIVGAGSVVTKTIPPYEIWAGNPAKFIKKINE